MRTLPDIHAVRIGGFDMTSRSNERKNRYFKRNLSLKLPPRL